MQSVASRGLLPTRISVYEFCLCRVGTSGSWLSELPFTSDLGRARLQPCRPEPTKTRALAPEDTASSLLRRSPGIAASFRRPRAELAPQQCNLTGVITVMRRNLPEHRVHGGLTRRLSWTQVLNFSRQLRNIGFREPRKPCQ